MSDALFDLPAVPAPVTMSTNGRRVAASYAEFVDEALPRFEQAADSGEEFTSWDIVERYDLPAPPRPESQWGGFIAGLRARGLIEHCGWDNSHRPGDNGSGVKTWRGVKQRHLRGLAPKGGN